MLTRADVERITENVLKGLSLEIDRNNFTEPNSRCIILKLGENEISRTYIDFTQRPEYEG